MTLNERQARRDLNELEQAGYLQREGEGAGTLYRRLNRTLTGHGRVCCKLNDIWPSSSIYESK